MISGDYSRYQLNTNQFYSLFTGKVSDETFELLSKSAADGNLDCIDILYNLALRHDYVGERSESILFDLFSGKIPGKTGIDREIQLGSLGLYKTACNTKGKNNEDMRKFYSPSRLLYIAGSAITNITQKQEVSSLLRGGATAQSQFEQLENLDDLWSNNRMLMTDEINAAMNNIIQNVDDLSLNYPIGLIDPVRNSNILSEQIYEKTAFNDYLNNPELFPINTGKHWVLLVLYKDESDREIKCIVFNSYVALNSDIKDKLTDSAKIAGIVEEKNIEFIDGDMQRNVPNGCGVFIVKAVDLLSRASEKNPVNILKAFTENFAKLSVEEQMLFNIQSRRQLYEHSIR